MALKACTTAEAWAASKHKDHWQNSFPGVSEQAKNLQHCMRPYRIFHF